MNWMTSVSIKRPRQQLDYHQKMLLMGSCFADEVGQRLHNDKFDCIVNPFGTLYNPASLADSVSRLLVDYPFQAQNLWQKDGMWHSWKHHSRFSAISQEESLKKINDSFFQASKQMQQLDVLLLTLGTNRCYQYRETGELVANCHKIPEREFDVIDMDVQQVVSVLGKALEQLIQLRPNVQIVLTVSPMRYLKYGLHESQLSKSVLLLAADQLQQRFMQNLSYFPAYEILMDELRDYRYYDTDMVHPSSAAVDYIYEQFKNNWMTEEAIALSGQWNKLRQALEHRPLHGNTLEYNRFLEQTLSKLKHMQEQHTELNLHKEIELCTIRLEKSRLA